MVARRPRGRIAVTAMIVPKDLGYAGIAGVPVQNGLYAAAAGAIVYALFCTSRHISTGPSSSLAAVAGGAVLVTGVGGEQAAELVAAITLVTGVLFLLLGVLRMGWISQFLSKAVVTGFLAGAAVEVVIGELPKLTGHVEMATAPGGSWRRGSGSLGRHPLDDARGGRVSLAVILGLRFGAPQVPGSAGARGRRARRIGCVRSRRARGGARRDTCRAGCRRPRSRLTIFTAALPDDRHRGRSRLLLIGFSQTAGDARAFADRHRYRIDVNQESVAQGMANVGAGVFQGMPVSTSLSASSLNESAGATRPSRRSPPGCSSWRHWCCSRRCSRSCPKAVLAAIIIDAVVFGMIDIPELRRLHRVARFDFWIAGGRDRRRALGRRAGRRRDRDRALARMARLRRERVPRSRSSAAKPARRCSATSTRYPDDETFPGIAVLRLDGGLFFATAEALDDRIRGLTEGDTAPRRRSCSTSKASTSSTRKAPRS